MKTTLLLLFSFISHVCLAQEFIEQQNSPFDGVRGSAIAFIDVEGDNDQDLIIAGWINDEEFTKETSLYLNDGKGNYTKSFGTPFQGVQFGSIAIADVDGDGDQDVHIAGKTNPTAASASLYINDGNGIFSETNEDVFDKLKGCASSFVDVDGDGDQDFFLAGIKEDFFGIAKLYVNDGNGNFSIKDDSTFYGAVDPALSFADIDGDNDQDLLLTGTHSPASPPFVLSHIYLNDGAGNFSLKENTPFPPCLGGSVTFADIDNDNDKDVLITGYKQDPIEYIADLYRNDGTGNFTLIENPAFQAVSLSSVDFADIDGDNDQDLIISGKNNPTAITRSTRLYTNDGNGNFNTVFNVPFEDVSFSALGFRDVDRDSDPDLVITGWTNDGIGIAKLYLNQSILSSTTQANSMDKFTILNNPVTEQQVQFVFDSDKNRRIHIAILDIYGRTLALSPQEIVSGTNKFSILLPNLPAGSYFARLDNGIQTSVKKFLVQ